MQVAVLCHAGGSLHAAPDGGRVAAGSAVIAGSPGNTTIHQASDRAIIQWNSFSIGTGERVEFNLPSAGSAVLNRVTGGGVSRLDGQLSSNGQVYLINPHGIVIGSGGVVATQGFVAGTGAVLDREFLEGRRMTVRGAGGSIVNSGTIDAGQGDVVLMAREIDQKGFITAGGSVALGAGTEVTLTRAGDGGMSVRVRGEGKIDQSGTVEAARAELRAAGGNPYSLAINHDGVTRATGAVRSGGKVVLTGGSGGVRIGGRLEARGGNVDVTGKRVELAATAEVDVSGARGGGTIRVGGGFGGRDADLAHADEVEVRDGARLAADALQTGGGGRIAVWSDRSTAFSGGLSVRGAGAGGAGGFAEVSSAGMLDFTGSASLGGSGGANGTLLLDPTDLTLGMAQAGSIVASLASGNVVVATSGSGAGAGNLTINSAISYSSANNLTFLAHGNVRVNATVRNAGSGDITAIAGWDGTTGADGSVGGADFLANAVTYGNSSGSIFIGGATQAAAISFGSKNGDLFLAGSSLTVSGGNTANAYSQIGWHAVDQGADHTATGDITMALKGGLALQAGSADRTNAQIGHGGATNADNTSTVDGTFSGNIDVKVAGATTLAGSNTATAFAQIGHGGLTSLGGKSGSISLQTGSLSAISGDRFASYTSIGHGGINSNSPAYGGAITVQSAGNLTLTSGVSQNSSARIGHGGLTATGATGDIEVTALDLLMNMKEGGWAVSQIGHGGESTRGTYGGNIDLTVRDIAMDTTGQFTLALIGHGGGLSGTLSGDVTVRARDVSMFVNNNNGGAMQIGHLTGSGSMTGTTTLIARDISMRAGNTGALPRIGMGASGGSGADATGDIVVKGRNLTMVGGNSFTSFARVGHGGLLEGTVRGDIDITISGETSLAAGFGAVPILGHSSTSRDPRPPSALTLSTGTLDDSATATASSVTLRNNVLSVFRSAGQTGDVTVLATGLNGDDGLLVLDQAYTGFSPYTVTFASTRDLTVDVPVTFQPSWNGDIRFLFGQAAGGTLRLNAAASTPGSGSASITGGMFDDTVILGNSGTIEGTIDGGGGVNTLRGDANANAFVINGADSGTLAGKTSGWLNFAKLSGEGGNDSFTFTNNGSLGGSISGGAGNNTLTGDADGNEFVISGTNSGSLPGKVGTWTGIQTLNGGAGPDRFTFEAAGSVNMINGGGGNDFLQLPDSGGQVTVTGFNSGTYLPGVASGWTNIENLAGGAGSDVFAFTNAGRLSGSIDGNGGGDVLRGDDDGNRFAITSANAGTLDGKLGSWREIASLEGGNGIDTLTGSQFGNEFVISGSNTGSITDLLQSWSGIENLAGGSGDDSFRFSGTGNLSGSLAGNSGRDMVIAPDGDSIFEVYGDGRGMLVGRVGFEWTGIRDLTGGAGNDLFRFFVTSSAGNVDGGGGINTLQGAINGEVFTISGANSGTMSGKIGGWSNISILLGGDGSDVFRFEGGSLVGGSIIGGAGLNRLEVAGETAANYVINGANQGTIAGLVDSWSGIHSLAAGDGDDRFEVAAGGSLTGPLDGGAGIDTLAATGAPAYFLVIGENFGHLDGSLTGWRNIETLEGSPADDLFLIGGSVHLISGMGGNDTLESYRTSSEFLIDGISSGSLGNMLWQGIENLVGGSGRDFFRFIGAGRINGLLDGGGGINRVDYSQADSGVDVDLAAGTASRTGGIAGITEVIGSVFGDIIRSSSFARLLDGGSGDDAFEIVSTDPNGGAVSVIGGSGNNELTFSFADSSFDSTVQITGDTISRDRAGGSERHSFSGITLLGLIAGAGSDRVETAGFAFAQKLDGGPGSNTLALDGSGYGLVDPASPVLLGNSGLITHVNFGTTEVIDATTVDEVRAIIDASSANFDLSERAEVLRFLWFLESSLQAGRRGGFHFVDSDGKPLGIMADSHSDP